MIILTKPEANGIHLLVKKTLVMWVIHSPCPKGGPGSSWTTVLKSSESEGSQTLVVPLASCLRAYLFCLIIWQIVDNLKKLLSGQDDWKICSECLIHCKLVYFHLLSDADCHCHCHQRDDVPNGRLAHAEPLLVPEVRYVPGIIPHFATRSLTYLSGSSIISRGILQSPPRLWPFKAPLGQPGTHWIAS